MWYLRSFTEVGMHKWRWSYHEWMLRCPQINQSSWVTIFWRPTSTRVSVSRGSIRRATCRHTGWLSAPTISVLHWLHSATCTRQMSRWASCPIILTNLVIVWQGLLISINITKILSKTKVHWALSKNMCMLASDQYQFIARALSDKKSQRTFGTGNSISFLDINV